MESKSNIPYDAPPPYPGTQGPPPTTMQPTPPGFYPTQQPGSVPMQGQHVATVVTVVANQQMGPYPMQITCPKCQAVVVTTIRPQTGLITWLACGLCLVFGCWFGCCLIPFCVNDMQDIEHHCPNCNNFVGAYRRL